MQKIEIIGTIGQDAAVKSISEKQYTSFSVAVSRKNKNGERKTTWFDVMMSGTVLLQYITKGTKVYLEGEPTCSAYMNKENKPVANITVWARNIEFCGGGHKDDQQASNPVVQKVVESNKQPIVDFSVDDMSF